jgi:hypothetical protein
MTSNMTIKARLILLVGAIMAVIVFNQAVGYFGIAKLQATTQDFVRLENLARELQVAVGRFKA